MLLPEMYGLNSLFTSKRNAQDNFLCGCSYKLFFLQSIINSVTKLVAVNGVMLPETPSGYVVERKIYGCENIFLLFSMFCINFPARCHVTKLVCL